MDQLEWSWQILTINNSSLLGNTFGLTHISITCVRLTHTWVTTVRLTHSWVTTVRHHCENWIFLQSCETKSGMEKMVATRLTKSCSQAPCRWAPYRVRLEFSKQTEWEVANRVPTMHPWQPDRGEVVGVTQIMAAVLGCQRAMVGTEWPVHMMVAMLLLSHRFCWHKTCVPACRD